MTGGYVLEDSVRNSSRILITVFKDGDNEKCVILRSRTGSDVSIIAA